MIISHARRFIFIKTKKTAGSSLEAALGRYCGDTDIITPLTDEEEEFRKRTCGRGAQNYRIPTGAWTARDWIRFLKGRRIEFYNHISAAAVRARLDERTWNEYFKFCFERNPFEKVISYAYFRYMPPDATDVNAHITDSMLLALRKGGSGLYLHKGQLLVDKVYRYEDMSQAIEDLGRRLGLEPPPELPRLKTGFRRNKRTWHEVLDKENIRRIRDCFSWELETLYPETMRMADEILKPVFPAGDLKDEVQTGQEHSS